MHELGGFSKSSDEKGPNGPKGRMNSSPTFRRAPRSKKQNGDYGVRTPQQTGDLKLRADR